jgi:hypothetical protein
MPELFRLEKEEFSEKYNEWWWTYSIQFELIFNKKAINYITITDYTWKNKKGRERITKELILNIIKEKVNGERLTPEPKKNPNWKRDHYVLKRIPFEKERYKLVFWFKDGTTNHLWVKNCHQQD